MKKTKAKGVTLIALVITIAGGIQGATDLDEINNCYNTGEVIGNKKGNIIAMVSFDGIIKNSFYITSPGYSQINTSVDDSRTIVENLTQVTQEQLKSDDIISQLGSEWKRDTNNINNGYPILSWQE